MKGNRASVIVDQQPPSLEGFQGRAEQLEQLHSALRDDRIRLVGLCSAGGYGKSTLAAKVYKEAEGFERKLWISFSQPYAFSLFGRWVLEQFQVEVDDRIGEEELVDLMLHQLGQSRCLLVLDNLGQRERSCYERQDQ